MIPVLRRGIYVENDGDKHYLYDRTTRQFTPLGPALLQTISLCDGFRLRDQVELELGQLIQTPEEAGKLLGALIDSGFICNKGSVSSLTEKSLPQTDAHTGVSSIAVRLPLKYYRLQFNQYRLISIDQGIADFDPYRITPEQVSERHMLASESYSRFITTLFGGDSRISNSSELSAMQDLINRVPVAPSTGPRLALDAGAGSGQMATPLSDAGWQPVLCDIDTTRITDEVDSVTADINDLPFADETFGLSCCLFVLEHIPDPYRALAELIRVTTTNGHILIAVPGVSWKDYVRRFTNVPVLNWEHMWGFGLGDKRFPYVIDIRNVVSFLKTSGCTISEAKGLWSGRSSAKQNWSALIEGIMGRIPVLRWMGEVLLIHAVRTEANHLCGRKVGDMEDTLKADMETDVDTDIDAESIRSFFIDLGEFLGKNCRVDMDGLPTELRPGVGLDYLTDLARHRVRVESGRVTVTNMDCRLSQTRMDVCAAHQGLVTGFSSGLSEYRTNVTLQCDRCEEVLEWRQTE